MGQILIDYHTLRAPQKNRNSKPPSLRLLQTHCHTPHDFASCYLSAHILLPCIVRRKTATTTSSRLHKYFARSQANSIQDMLGRKKDKPSNNADSHPSSTGCPDVHVGDQVLILYDPSRPLPPRAPINGGNTCYLDAILVALFAEYDGWDGLLHSSPSSPSLLLSPSSSNYQDQQHLHSNFLTQAYYKLTNSHANSTSSSSTYSTTKQPALAPPNAFVRNMRLLVNTLRSGSVVQSSALNVLRDALVSHAGWYPGRGQHDAAELLTVLLDVLCAPFVSLVKNLRHSACPDVEADHVPFTERMLWLNFPISSPSSSSIVSNDSVISLEALIDAYFFGEVVHGLRRDVVMGTNDPKDRQSCQSFQNEQQQQQQKQEQQQQQEQQSQALIIPTPTLVDATVTRSLIPTYTPIRETGDHSSATASRYSFAFLTVPFAISRFKANGTSKDRRSIRVPTVLDASQYLGPFAMHGVMYTLLLRSVVCHLGETIKSGHYVTYTYVPQGHVAQVSGWRRWDDLEDEPVRSVKSDVVTGEPVNSKWAQEIRTNCYLLFYELVPGENLELEALEFAKKSGKAELAPSDVKMTDPGEGFQSDLQSRLDAIIAAEAQGEELKAVGVRDPFAHLLVANGVNGNV